MTMQEYFDKTVAHLRTLKGRAVEYATCSYLTEDGRKCAVGVHIPDGHPGQAFVGGVDDLLLNFSDLSDVVLPNHEDGLDLAKNLQDAHDSRYNWDGDAFDAESALLNIARTYSLIYTPPGAVAA